MRRFFVSGDNKTMIMLQWLFKHFIKFWIGKERIQMCITLTIQIIIKKYYIVRTWL